MIIVGKLIFLWVRIYVKKLTFFPWFNKIKIYFKTVEKRGLTKNGAAKKCHHFRSKKNNTCLFTNIDIILNSISMVLIAGQKIWQSIAKSETFFQEFFIRWREVIFFTKI